MKEQKPEAQQVEEPKAEEESKLRYVAPELVGIRAIQDG